jgi:hypothetical protein
MNTIHIPILKNDRVLFFGTFAAGFALCTRGISQAPMRGWLHPVSLLGCLLGGLAVLLGAAVLLRRYPVFIKNDRQALLTLLGLIGVKALLAALYPVFP